MSVRIPEIPEIPEIPVGKIIRVSTLMAQFGISRTTVYNWIKKRVLPQPRPIGPQMVGWFPGDLRDFYGSMERPEA